MEIERGQAGLIPWAASGTGAPVVVLSGLSTSTGVGSDRFVRNTLSPLRGLAGRRRVVMNRWPGLPAGLTMADFAQAHAEALDALVGEPVDVVGISTGGSIAQQLAADHPGSVRRLVVLSGACRLSPTGRGLQSQFARLLRAGRPRAAARLAAGGLVPRGLRTVVGAAAWAAGPLALPGPAGTADLIATLEAEDDFDLATCARPVQAPTLVVVGGRDRFYGPELAAETAALIPTCHLATFPRRGHVTVASDPRAVATIAGFLTA